MNALEHAIWFVGDLDDPWVANLADALPQDVTRIPAQDDWLEAVNAPGDALPSLLVLHRATLTPRDVERLNTLRNKRDPRPGIILCVGPYARYADLERCSEFVDVVLPEATARDTILRHLAERTGRGESLASSPNRAQIQVVSSDFELRQTLATACVIAGYRARGVAGWTEVSPGGVVVWDVPVLERDWLETLSRQTPLSSVITLLGFADRAMVLDARSRGASACLESPCELADLFFVIERLSNSRIEPAHGVPPPPVSSRRPTRTVVDPRRDPYN